MTRVAVYAGTFDPPTLGHRSVVARAAALFDEVLVVCAVNPAKRPLFSADERALLWAATAAGLPNVRCEQTEGLIVELARQRGARFLVRGIRGASDADYEAALAHANRALAPEILTVFLPADPHLSQVSSSRLKQLAAAGEDVSAYCAPEVARQLAARLGAPGKLEDVHG